jgi:hypothetical protein
MGKGVSTQKKKGSLIWYTDSPKIERGTEAGVYCHGTRRKLSSSLGKYTTLFQAEVYFIKESTVENLDRDYRNRFCQRVKLQ